MSKAIQINNLSKTYRKGWRLDHVEAIRDVTLDVDEGEAFGFVGPNGAGKSSTIRVMTGLATPSSGSVHLFDKDSKNPAARVGVGYVPESPYLYDYLTPLEILNMSLSLHRVRVPDMTSHCMGWLERLGIEKSARTKIKTFSKGMTQRVAIAQALCIRPRLLILDEPLSGLDPVGRHEVVELLAEYKREGGTLFFTSHVLHDVERLADRFGLIHEGQLRSVRSPAELVGKEEVCIVRSLGNQAIDGWREESPGRWMGSVARNELWEALDKLRAAGHVIVEIRPKLSLEQAFLQAIGRQALM